MANPFQGDDVDPFSGARDEEGNIEREDAKMPDVGAPMKMASFGEAFKEARGRGDKTFEYMGKKYTTEMAGTKKAPEGPKTAFQKRAAKQTAAREARAAASAARKNAPLGQMSDVVGAKKGGRVKKYAAGGSVSSASKRADGCAQRGKTRGKMV